MENIFSRIFKSESFIFEFTSSYHKMGKRIDKVKNALTSTLASRCYSNLAAFSVGLAAGITGSAFIIYTSPFIQNPCINLDSCTPSGFALDTLVGVMSGGIVIGGGFGGGTKAGRLIEKAINRFEFREHLPKKYLDEEYEKGLTGNMLFSLLGTASGFLFTFYNLYTPRTV